MRAHLNLDRIKIGKHYWNIEHSDKHDDADHDDLGMCIWDDKLIWISTRQSDSGRLATLVHEILHAMEYEWKLKIPHALIRLIEKPIARIIANNFLPSAR